MVLSIKFGWLASYTARNFVNLLLARFLISSTDTELSFAASRRGSIITPWLMICPSDDCADGMAQAVCSIAHRLVRWMRNDDVMVMILK